MHSEMEIVPVFQMGWQLNQSWVYVLVSELSALPFVKNIRKAERKGTEFYFPSLLDFCHEMKLVKVSLQEPQQQWEVEDLSCVGINFKWNAKEFLR